MFFLQLFTCFIQLDYILGACLSGTYLNICGHCVGFNSGRDEMYGLDRCMVCGGNSSCVGCDGVVNSNYRTDACGKCLPKNDPKWNDCLVIAKVYPDVVDRALGNNVVALSLIGAGLSSENRGLASTRSCQVVAQKQQITTPIILETGLEETDLELKVEIGKSAGLFGISCNGIQGQAILRVVNSLAWDVTHVEPTVISVDDNPELVIDVSGDLMGDGPVWCFLRCDGAPIKINLGVWVSEKRVKCLVGNARLAAKCDVGVSATEEAAYDDMSTGAVVGFSIKSSAPVAVSAELDPDLSNLLVRFSANIQMTAPCDAIFSNSSKLSLITSRCAVSGDILMVALRPEHPLLSFVEIISGNGIRRIGLVDPELTPESLPTILSVSTKKVLPPNLSLLIPSVLCLKSEELKVASIGSQRLNYEWSIPPPAIDPGTQRENLLLWEKTRYLEKHLNHGDSAHLEADELLADARYNIRVKGTNALGEQQSVSSALTFSPTAPVTVTVNALPGVTAVVAELNVTECAPLPGGLTFRWFLNDQPVSAAGRLILLSNLKPASYNISCSVLLYKTGEILANGWVTTQVLPSEEKTLLSPAKQTVGTMDSVSIKAFSPYGVAGVWFCVDKDRLPCVAPGSDASLVENKIENNVTVLTIPAGVLAVGSYTWRLKNMESTEAEVVVKSGIPPSLTVSLIPPLVNPTADLQINGDARRLEVDCTLQWSTVYRVGFNYFNLQEDVGLGDTLKILPDDPTIAALSLFVPTAQDYWAGLMAEASYMLRFTAVCPVVGSAYVDVPVTVNVPPNVAPLKISPVEGTALETEFLITGGEARDVFHDYPIQFVWSLKDEGNVVPLYVGSTPRSLRFLLPPGKISIRLEVCDIHGTCSDVSSPVAAVARPSTVSDHVITKLKREISNAVLEGSTVFGLGKAVVAVKTLKSERQLQNILDTTDDAISTRARDLKLDIAKDPAASATSLEFLQHVLDCMPYLKPSQLTLDLIVELKDAVAHSTMSRVKRDVQENTVRKLTVEEAKKLLDVSERLFMETGSEERIEGFLGEVRRMMRSLCGNQEVRVESKHVDLWVSTKLSQSDFDRNLGPSARVNFKSNRNGCLAIATFSPEIFATGDFNLLSKIYDVELVDRDDFVTVTSRDPMMKITIPLTIPAKNASCLTRNGLSWTHVTSSTVNKHGNIVCTTKEFGYFAAFGERLVLTTTTTVVMTSAVTQATTFDPITKTTTTSSTDVVGDEKTTEETASEVKTTTVVTSASFDGVQFKIEEDFDEIIGGDRPKIQDDFSQQLAELLLVDSQDLRVFVEKGSILVRVYFLVTMDNNQAWVVVNQLTRYVQDGELKLSANGKILNVPAQNVTYLILPDYGQAETIRWATLIVVAVVIVFVLCVIILAARKSPQNEFLSHAFQADDSAPCYLNFDNDPSLEGSSASLAKYRRPFAVNLETTT